MQLMFPILQRTNKKICVDKPFPKRQLLDFKIQKYLHKMNSKLIQMDLSSVIRALTLWEKEKMLVPSISSCSNNILKILLFMDMKTKDCLLKG